ncbi:MAG TPA: mandelate racemase/muconate lactonizing enzyme family protein, partial [Reyranellaceae bacterium]|nr:mandelate racemase/muconate lactonizing enzyme family protein [Reyranellaceae bacterium]
MKIVKIEDLHCDAGWRDFSFLKITTDEGIVGWSEYNEGYGSAGITAVIRRMAQGLIGENPRAVERIMSTQYAITRQAPGGINQQAMAAIENALLDVKAKSLGVPVYELFGGKVRDRLTLYWSHCGSYRFRNAEVMGVEPVRSFDDVVKLGKHVKERGFKALKTNIFRFDLNNMHQPGFGRTPGGPELNADVPTLKAINDGLAAFRQGAGPDMGILLDTNFNFKTEGYKRVADTIAPFNVRWMEVDTHDPPSLAEIRRSA